MRQKMERLINGLLWIIILVFGFLAARDWVEDNYVPDAFVQPMDHAPSLVKISTKVEHGDDSWLKTHFSAPVPPQGDAPEDWTEVEASLDPTQCGVCHPAELADWEGSWHAMGMGPGMMGQLSDSPSANMVESCQRCHAPNAEQYPELDGAENPHFDESLRAQGLTCAGCHVRDWTRYGPPSDSPAPAPEPVEGEEDTEVPRQPHDGFVGNAVYDDSIFCESCHDFRGDQKMLNDKYLQETYGEWRRTQYAEDGITCQSCHMPEGRHVWLGVHDKELVQGGMAVEAELEALGTGFMEPIMANLTVTNTGVGHRMPTYTTPRIVLIMEQTNAAGEPIEGTRQEGYIGRDVSPDLSTENYDTRLMPEESFTMRYEADVHEEATHLDARVEVWPDEGYTRNYRIWIEHKAEEWPNGLPMLEEALEASLESQYIAWEQSVPIGSDG
jgi:hypothetical protein